jgi:hypothetical protein
LTAIVLEVLERFPAFYHISVNRASSECRNSRVNLLEGAGGESDETVFTELI